MTIHRLSQYFSRRMAEAVDSPSAETAENFRLALRIAFALMILGCFFGFGLSPYFKDTMQMPIEKFTTFNIFRHNLIACTPLFLGVLTFGFTSVVFLLFQSTVITWTIFSSPISPLEKSQLLFGHAFFEAYAIVLAASIGMYIPISILRKQRISIDVIFKKTLLFVFLLALSALIESRFTFV
jgi:uncharacterized membrane protein SpoIIM required for sporulation